MKLRVLEDIEQVAVCASTILIDAINNKPDLVLCLPTGRTPRRIYAHLASEYRAGRVSFANATVFNLDEYVGLSGDVPGAFSAYMKSRFLDHVDLPPGQWHIPDGCADDPHAEAAAYDRAITFAGGLDVALLGVGANGHIGFNEPGSACNSPTRVVDLSEETLLANADDLPTRPRPSQGITVGIASILAAGSILLVASGASKAKAITQLLSNGSKIEWPVAALYDHPDLTVLVDSAAVASTLP